MVSTKTSAFLRVHSVPALVIFLTAVSLLFNHWISERHRLIELCHRYIIEERVQNANELFEELAPEIHSFGPVRKLVDTPAGRERYPDHTWDRKLSERYVAFPWYSALRLFVVYGAVDGTIADTSLIYYNSERVDLGESSGDGIFPRHPVVLAGGCAVYLIVWYRLALSKSPQARSVRIASQILKAILIVLAIVGGIATLLIVPHFFLLYQIRP